MKQISLVINAILAVAIAILFYLHFSGNTSGAKKSSASSASTENSGEPNLVYFNADSLLTNYLMYDDERTEMEKKTKEYETRFSNDQKTFEKEAREFQQRAEFLTITDREAREQKLMKKQQELMQLQERLSGQIAKDEAAMTEKIFDTIESYLKEYVEDKNISYIFSYSRGGGIWYADKANDITSELVEALNTRYQERKKAE